MRFLRQRLKLPADRSRANRKVLREHDDHNSSGKSERLSEIGIFGILNRDI